MSTNLEIEAKILVNEDEFKKIIAFLNLKEEQAIKQVNYYIDTPNTDLRHFGFGLRIRHRLEQYTLTLKSPMAEGTLEKNQQLNKDQYQAFIKDGIFPEGLVKDFLLMYNFDVQSLKILTSLTTYRIDTIFQGSNISIDKNNYGDSVDFEIESERTSIQLAQDILNNLCLEANINYRPNDISKHARALQAANY
jgi:uncharacterized protein YjbK